MCKWPEKWLDQSRHAGEFLHVGISRYPFRGPCCHEVGQTGLQDRAGCQMAPSNGSKPPLCIGPAQSNGCLGHRSLPIPRRRLLRPKLRPSWVSGLTVAGQLRCKAARTHLGRDSMVQKMRGWSRDASSNGPGAKKKVVILDVARVERMGPQKSGLDAATYIGRRWWVIR